MRDGVLSRVTRARARADGTERTTRTMGRRSDANETTTPESAAAASAWKRHAEDAHRVSSAETLARMGVLDVAHGLDLVDVHRRREACGVNALPPEPETSFVALVVKQFDDVMVKVLVAAAATSLALALWDGEAGMEAFLEPGVIVAILIANAAVGVATEKNAERAIEELKTYQAEFATCTRDGEKRKVSAEELVPGDVLEIATGEKVPADCRVVKIHSNVLKCDQALLTGESGSVMKTSDAVDIFGECVLQDKTCMVYSGTTVTVGKATCVVVGTGGNTAIGKIQHSLEQTEEEMTPLKKKLDEFGNLLGKIIAVICVLVWVVNIGHFADKAHGGFFRGAIYYFKIAVALAVAAIPEGLPAVITTCLALGTRRMAKKNALVRTLPSVETLGCTSVICSDKTGTLTCNVMTVTRMCVLENAGGAELTHYGIRGEAYAPNGEILDARGIAVHNPADSVTVAHLAMCCSMCNDSSLNFNKEKGSYEKIGEATELALRVLTEKIGLPSKAGVPSRVTGDVDMHSTQYWDTEFEKLATLEFTSERKRMSTLCSCNGESTLFVKGAPESVLALCTSVMSSQNGRVDRMTDKIREQLLLQMQNYASDALRVLALAMKSCGRGETCSESDEQGLTFIGLVGMIDPPRPEVRYSLQTCKEAGIRVIMVTGDNQQTAEAIASQIGLGDAYNPLTGGKLDNEFKGRSFTGAEFESMTEEQREESARSMCVFSRVEPAQKSKLVEILKRQGNIVAMTGDGVNDAPALKCADIGIAMGSGTAVAKSASDMVLADDNFSTIIEAVAEGRAIYNNAKQFIRYMVSSNIGEVVCIFIAAALGFPETLVPVQLLWVNLVTDGLPATALGFNRADGDIMSQRPRSPREQIVDRWLLIRYLIIGVYVGVATVGSFGWWFMSYEGGPQLTWAQLTSASYCIGDACDAYKDRSPSTMAMSTLVLIEMFNALNSLSENRSLLTHPPSTNWWLLSAIVISMWLHMVIMYVPSFAKTFTISALNYDEWKAVFWFSIPVIFIDEVLKYVTRRHRASIVLWLKRAARKDILPRTRSSSRF